MSVPEVLEQVNEIKEEARLLVNWELAKLDWLRLRADGVKFEDALTQVGQKHDVSRETVRSRCVKGKWADAFNATQGLVQSRITEALNDTAEEVANNIGKQLLEQLQGLSSVKGKRPVDALTKATVLEKLARIPSRFNPDAQLTGNVINNFNFRPEGAKQIEQPAQVIDVQAEVTRVETHVRSEAE